MLEFYRSALDQWQVLAKDFPPELVLAPAIVPLLLALVSRRLGALLGVALLMLVAFGLYVGPFSWGAGFAAAAYLGGLVLAFSAIGSARRHRALQDEVAEVRRQAQQLQAASERQLLNVLKSGSDQNDSR